MASSSSIKKGYQAAPLSKHYEFGGPTGALGVTLAVPFFTYWLAFACTSDACPVWPWADFLSWHKHGLGQALGDLGWWKAFWSWEAMAVYTAWYAFNVVCLAVLPGETVQGGELRNGEKLSYKMNGLSFSCCWEIWEGN